ncbi:MAG TPA: metallophosphoesterase [Gemmatimonadales bacterium]|nr:metallophosphoesterase [Gemmatimonadales bacterium]
MTLRWRRLLPAIVALAACSRVIREPEPPVLAVNPASVETTLFLIGDAGSPHEGEPVLAALERQVSEAPGERLILFLGDNIYPMGLPDTGATGREHAEKQLLPQIQVATRTRTRTWFIPGNHDWEYMGPGGWDAIRRQAAFIDIHGAPYAAMYPQGGCPGPEVADVGERLRVVMIDTQWWLHDFDKPHDSTAGCAHYERPQVIRALDSAMAQGSERHVIVVGHHPLRSGGVHGGHLGLIPHLFPLRDLADNLWVPMPVLGSYYAFNRKQGSSNQDVNGPENVRMRRALDWVFARRKPLIYAAGHEHTLQVLRGHSARHLLISGSGIIDHVSEVHQTHATRFAAALSGYMRLDIMRDGRVRLGVLTVERDSSVTEAFSTFLE